MKNKIGRRMAILTGIAMSVGFVFVCTVCFKLMYPEQEASWEPKARIHTRAKVTPKETKENKQTKNHEYGYGEGYIKATFE